MSIFFLYGEKEKKKKKKKNLTNTLNSIENTKPKPKSAPKKSAGDRSTGPWDVVSDCRRGPHHLAPPRRTEADGKDGNKPRMTSRKMPQHPKRCRPQDDEKCD